MIRNEFIEVHINEATGGISHVKEFGRKPNRLSQQLALRFRRERVVAGPNGEPAERTFYSQMHCKSITVASGGPATWRNRHGRDAQRSTGRITSSPSSARPCGFGGDAR